VVRITEKSYSTTEFGNNMERFCSVIPITGQLNLILKRVRYSFLGEINFF
jgi:hypothetical protein